MIVMDNCDGIRLDSLKNTHYFVTERSRQYTRLEVWTTDQTVIPELRHVVRRLGQAMYEVAVGRDKWTRHQNQLRKRLFPDHPSRSRNLPLEVLLDTFNLPAVPTEEVLQQIEGRSIRW